MILPILDLGVLAEAFKQAQLKVYRADQHRGEVEHWFAEYVKTDFCRLVEERNTQTGRQVFRVVADQPLPAEMFLAIGDTFHNLSCAMDYIATGIVRAARLRSGRVHFPSDESRKQLRATFRGAEPGKGVEPGKGAGRNRKVLEACPAFVAMLLAQVKPYKGGNLLAWEIRQADNIDKHNLIIPTVVVTALADVVLLDPQRGNQITITNATVHPGGALHIVDYAMGGAVLEVQGKGLATAKLTFPNNAEIFAAQEVLPTLRQCVQATTEFLNLVGRLFNSPSPYRRW